jgi:Protein of unknown function (DUF1579)
MCFPTISSSKFGRSDASEPFASETAGALRLSGVDLLQPPPLLSGVVMQQEPFTKRSNHMRLIAITLIVLGAATPSGPTNAGDTPKRSAELQVLDRFVGTWDFKVTAKVPGQKAETHDTVETRKWSGGGGVVLFENATPPEFHMALAYDPNTKEYTGILMSGLSRGLLTGTWDEGTQTITFKGAFSDGNKLVSTHRFIDKDHAEHSGVIRAPDGKVVLELFQKQTRCVK